MKMRLLEHMNVTKYIGRQFANPKGIAGKISTYFMNRLNGKQYKSVIRLFHEINPKNVLDIGFGNGYLLNKLAVKEDTHFYGIEISEDMLKQAGKRNRKAIKDGRMSLHIGNVHQIPFEDSAFDFIYTVNTVYFWDDLEKGYLEIMRVLKEGGVFINVFYTKEWLDKLRYTKYDFHKYSQKEIRNGIKKIGFAKITLKEIKKDCAYC